MLNSKYWLTSWWQYFAEPELQKVLITSLHTLSALPSVHCYDGKCMNLIVGKLLYVKASFILSAMAEPWTTTVLLLYSRQIMLQKNNLVKYPQRRSNFSGMCNLKLYTSSVYPELFQGIAHDLTGIAFLRNITLLSINMKATWRVSFPRSLEQAYQWVRILEKQRKY